MKYSLLKRISAFVLAFALVMTTAFNAVGTTQANAAKKATVSAKGATVTVGASKNIKVSIKCKAKAKATIKVAFVKGATGKVTKSVTNSNAKKAAKTCKSTIKVTGKKAGKVKLSITPYINGKKAGKAKKITVTVKAKATTEAATTAATTAASADATTQATTELPALTSIDVTAVTKTLDIGGKTVVSAKSTTPGIEIASVTYSSDNSAAKVDANTGVVEGVSYGTAIITATAVDANGNKATASVAIEVKALDVTVDLVSSADGAVTLAPKETKKFGVKVTPATWVMEYTSSNEQVATVSADGTITAVAAGTAVISATAQGTAKRAICNVTVVASSYGIAWAAPNHANSVKVAFTTAIAKADQDKIAIDLSVGGSKQTVTQKWATDGTYVELVKATNYSAASNYVVSISGTSVSIDKNAASATFEIKDLYEDKLVVASGQAFPLANRIKVQYQVLDQYGDDFKTAVPSKITWYLSSDNNRLSLGTKSLVANNDTYGVAVINVTGSFDNVDTKQDYNFLVSVRGTLTAKSSVSGYSDVTIRPVKLIDVKLGVINPNASGEAQPVYQNTTSGQKIPITVKALAEGNVDWDADVYQSYVSDRNTNGVDDPEDFVNYYANNLDVRLSDISGTMAGATIEPEYVDHKFTGRFIINVPANAYGAFSISLAADAKATPQVTKTEVLKAATAAKVVFGSDVISGKLGEKVSVPVTFQDQYEKAIDSAAVAGWTDFTVSSDDLDSASIKKLGNQITYNKATNKFDIDLLGLTFKTGVTTGKFTLTCGTDSAKEYNKTSLVTSKVIELTKGREVGGLAAKSDNLVAKDGGYELNIIGNQPEAITISAVDQYGDPVDADTYKAVVTGTAAAADTVADTTKNTSTTLTGSSIVGADVTKWVGSNRSFTVTGAPVTKTESETLSVQLYKTYVGPANAGNVSVGKPITIKVNVNVKPTSFELVPSPTSVTAGTPINITINALDSLGNVVKTYSGKHELTITGTNGDSKKFNGDKAVKFANGTATVSVPTTVAGAGIKYSTKIATADTPAVFTTYTSSTGVEIKSGNVKSAGLTGNDANHVLVITLYDAGGNKVANPDKALNITNVKVINDLTKDDVTKEYVAVDSESTITTYKEKVGSDIIQEIPLIKDFAPDLTFTATIEDYNLPIEIKQAKYDADNATSVPVPTVVSEEYSSVAFKTTTVGADFVISVVGFDTWGRKLTNETVTFTNTGTNGNTITTNTLSSGKQDFPVDGSNAGTYKVKIGTVEVGSITVADSVATYATNGSGAFSSGVTALAIKDQYGDAFTLASAATPTATVKDGSAITAASVSIATDGKVTVVPTGTPAASDEFSFSYLAKTFTAIYDGSDWAYTYQ